MVYGKELDTSFLTTLTLAAVFFKNLALDLVPIFFLFRLNTVNVFGIPLYKVTKTRFALLSAFLWLSFTAFVTQACGF